MTTFHLTTNLTSAQLKGIHAGDEILFTGTFFTARDRAHRWLMQHNFKPLHQAILYHCGPMYRSVEAGLDVLAAGPTTSARFNHYTPTLIKKYNLPVIIGKGGMNEAVQQALLGQAIYCTAIGGAAVLYADCITGVTRVYKKDFGMTDAIWELRVKDFPVICMIDSYGKNLFSEVEQNSKQIYKKIVNKMS